MGKSDLDNHVGAVAERSGKCRGSREGVGLAPPHFQPHKGLWVMQQIHPKELGNEEGRRCRARWDQLGSPSLGAETERSAEECREASVPGRTDAKAPQEAILMPPGWREGTAGGEAAAMSQNGSELVYVVPF